MKFTHVSLLSLAALCLVAPISQADSIGDFEDNNHEWRFSNGGEYAGAVGSAEVEKVEGAQGAAALKIEANFEEGGQYVAVYRSLDSTAETSELHFNVLAPKLNYLLVRLRDGSGQTHQHRIPLEGSDKWQTIEITDFSRSQQHWGGNDDKVFQQPLVEVGILIEKNGIEEAGDKADMYIDAVETKP